jgi:hypothetical protein
MNLPDLTEALSKIQVLLDVTSLFLDSLAVKIKALCSSETSVTICQLTRRNITEDSNLQHIAFVFTRTKRLRKENYAIQKFLNVYQIFAMSVNTTCGCWAKIALALVAIVHWWFV